MKTEEEKACKLCIAKVPHMAHELRDKSIECPICGATGPDDCGHGEQVANWGKAAAFETAEQSDGAGAFRMQFRTNGKPVFSISPDNRITLHNDIELDEASRLFWEAVEHITPGTLSVKVNEDVEPGDLVTRDMIEPEIACAACGKLPSRDGNKCEFVAASTQGSSHWKCENNVVVYGGSSGGGKMHMTEQQHKAFLEKDPDYVSMLMTPANNPAKTSKEMQGLTFAGFDYERHELRTLAGMLMWPHRLARVELLPSTEVRGFSFLSDTCRVLVINGVGITGIEPGSIIDKAVEKALKEGLKTEP